MSFCRFSAVLLIVSTGALADPPKDNPFEGPFDERNYTDYMPQPMFNSANKYPDGKAGFVEACFFKLVDLFGTDHKVKPEYDPSRIWEHVDKKRPPPAVQPLDQLNPQGGNIWRKQHGLPPLKQP